MRGLNTASRARAGMSPTKAIPGQHGHVTVQLHHAILGTYEVAVDVDYGHTTTQTVRW